MNNRKTNKRMRSFSRFKRGGSNRPRYSARNSRAKSAQLDISSFINKAVTSAPKEAFVPEHSFKDFKFNSGLLRSIEQRGYRELTPIQDKVIPPIIQGKDVVGLANTGTGKTAAFLIPLVAKVSLNPQEQILIVTPTRELAQQIEQELVSVTREAQVSCITCIGGERIGSQIRRLKVRSQFIIGTPGRLIDLIEKNKLKLGGIRTVVLDEADRMLDMGFINDIKFLMTHITKSRQTLCFSATMSQKIQSLINDFLKDPITISVKTTETPENIEQDVVRTRNLNKVDVLQDLLENNEFKKVLVFGRTKRGVENLSRTLTKRGLKSESIHGNKTQSQRKRALLNFKNSRVQVLVATDVAARGLHIRGITHVINYEIPETYEDYIHRIGRTGRGTHQGKALTFVS